MNNDNRKIISYDPNTGQPIYEEQPATVTNKTITSYDPNTGQPIYGEQVVNQSVVQQPMPTNNPLPKKKKKTLLLLLIPLIVILVILSCVLLIPSKKGTIKTFMIYMVGSNLESISKLGTYELEGIDPQLVDMENVNVVLIAGGSKKWHNDYIDVDETSIYELTPTGFKKVKEQSIKNMGSSDVLSDFLNYSYSKYKADQYNLILWNHGGGIQGSEYDEISSDFLSLPDMSTALKNSAFNKNNKIETVIFGTCLNGSIEMNNVFKDYANYFVASEEISISYKGASDFQFINEVELKDDGSIIGRKFIQKYKEKMENLKELSNIYNREYNVYSTYSVVNLNNIDNLNNALNNFFKDVDIDEHYNEIAKVRSNLYQYAYIESDEPSYDMVDLYNLVYELKNLSPTNANKVLNEFKKTVVYNYATNSESMGISIYFPYNGTEVMQKSFLLNYDEINPIDSYSKFVVEFRSMKLLGASNRLSFSENKSSVVSENKVADFELELTEEQKQNYAKAEYIVFRDNKDGYYLPVYRGKEVMLDNNKLTAEIKDRQLRVNDSNEKRIITLIEETTEDSYITYSTYGMLNDYSSNEITEWKNDVVKLTLILDKTTNKVKISKALLTNTDGLPGRVVADIKDYDSLSLGSSSYKMLDQKGNFNENWSNEKNTIFEGIDIDPNGKYTIELEDYQDGYEYYCVFIIYDVNNNSYYSKPLKMK